VPAPAKKFVVYVSIGLAVFVAAFACFWRKRQAQAPSMRGGLEGGNGGDLLQPMLEDSDAADVAAADSGLQEPPVERKPLRQWEESFGRPSGFMAENRGGGHPGGGSGSRAQWTSILDAAEADGGVLSSVPRSCFINIDQLEMRDALGGGASGVVNEARYYAAADRGGSHVPVAVKQVELEIIPEEKDLLGREVRILASLRHPNLVAFIGIARSRRGRLCIVTELCDCDLTKLLLRSPAYRGMNGRSAMAALARQISAAVSFLHARGVIHRDLKPQNVLISRAGQDVICKLCDYGISSIAEHQRSVHTLRTLTIGQGTAIYMAPEASDGWHGKARYDHRVDIYAFGIMLWNMWTGEKDPYSHVESAAALARHLAGGARPTFPAPVGGDSRGGVAEVAILAAKCWAERPQDRPSFVDIDREMAIWESDDVLQRSDGGTAPDRPHPLLSAARPRTT
jgi:serine/threonine protein kinase